MLTSFLCVSTCTSVPLIAAAASAGIAFYVLIISDTTRTIFIPFVHIILGQN